MTNRKEVRPNILNEDEKIYRLRCEGKLKDSPRFKLIDLFSGAGGMTLGFTEAFGHHFTPIWANDNNQYCVDTYNTNFGNHCIYGDIVKILSESKEDIPKADVVIGGPPCQGFSLLNRNRKNDNRRELWLPFLEIVEISDSSFFVIENVPHILGTNEHKKIIVEAEKMGFNVVSGKLSAADYGVPQTRTRAIILGSKTNNPSDFFPPRKTNYNPGDNGHTQNSIGFSGNADFLPSPQKWLTVRDAISDLPPPSGTQIRDISPPLNLHFGRNPTEKSMKRYRAIPKEGMNRFDLQKHAPELTPQCWINKKSGGTDLFGRLWWDKPAVTMRTEFYKPEKGRYLHPKQHRPITHREAARFQSFPDSFIFKTWWILS